MATELFANNFAVQLASGCAPTDTTISVNAAAPTALQAAGQFRILIDQEYMLVTGGASGTTWNVTRGAGTGESPTPTAVSHGRGAWVTHMLTAAAIANLGPGGGGAGNTNTSVVALGNTGSAQTVSLASTTNEIVIVTGTLNANCTITISNRAAGCQVLLLLLQDGTGNRTLNISDGSTSQAVAINSAASSFTGVLCDCPNSTDIYVNTLSAPGPAGAAGATGPSGSGALVFTAKSANYTAANLDYVQMTGQHTVTLPSPTAGSIVGVVSVNGTGTTPCTVSTPSGAILGKGVAASATSILLGAAGAHVTLEADGTNWNIIGGCQDSGWITPGTFTNSWVNGSPAVQYRLIENRVWFNGQMSSGTAATSAFTLPAGYRPAATNNIPQVRYNTGTFSGELIQVTTAGSVIPQLTDSTAVYVNGSFTVD